jgi:hypothetical protein
MQEDRMKNDAQPLSKNGVPIKEATDSKFKYSLP